MPWSQFFDDAFQDPTDPRTVLLNLALVLILGQILAWHYLRFSPVLTNKKKFARVFVFIAATTMLVIAVVQRSTALSLGLVGALSIIRFRTPIKEPEELAYLFLAIALGLGLGANLRLVTTLVFLVILGYMTFASLGKARTLPPRLLVHVAGPLEKAPPETVLRELLREVQDGSSRVDLRRVDTEGSTFNATLVLDLQRGDQVGALLSRIQKVLPTGTISVVEGNSLD
jgi:hypothetical protein